MLMPLPQFRLLLLLLILLAANPLQAQDLWALSEDGQYFAVLEPAGKGSKGVPQYRLRSFRVSSGESVLDYTYGMEKPWKPQNVLISPDGKTIAIREGYYTRVIDAISTTEIARLQGHCDIYFPHLDPVFLAYGEMLASYDAFTGKRQVVYDRTRRQPRDRSQVVGFSPDDRFVYVINKTGRVQLWDLYEQRPLKRFTADFLRFDPIENTVTTVRGLKAQTYDGETLGLKGVIKPDREIKKWTDKQAQQGISYNVRRQQVSVSPSGSFMLLPVDLNGSGNLLLQSTRRYSLAPIQSDNIGSITHHQWLTDTTVLLTTSEGKFHHLTLSQAPVLKELDLQWSASKITDKALLSPNASFAATYSGLISKKLRIVADKRPEQAQLAGIQPIVFTPDEQYLIGKKDKEQWVKIDLVKRPITFPGGWLPSLEPFSDSAEQVNEPPYLPSPYPPGGGPPGYNYHRAKTMLPIDSAAARSEKLNLVFNRLDVSDSVVKLRVHLIDEDDTYYYGAASERWKRIWCNLILKSRKEAINQISDFEVSEMQDQGQLPGAVVLVLDHSGSMGDAYARKLQEAAVEFINRKNKRDAIAIIKYDHRVRVESPLDNKSKKLKDDLKMNGLSGFGGRTSLLDATNAGIAALQRVKGYDRKVVIVLTDGLENSSYTSEKAIIRRSAKNDVQVHTIGFGPRVYGDYLMALAYKNGGSFYPIFHPNDMDWIFDDIYSKLRNYYLVKFKVDKADRYQAALKICPPDSITGDTLGFSFQIKSSDLDPLIRPKPDYSMTPPFEEVDLRETGDSILVIEDLQDFDQITIGTETTTLSERTIVENDYDRETAEAEFEAIQFPDIKFDFDQTTVVPGTDKGLDEVVVFLKKYPSVRIEIAGHTDNTGDEVHNRELSLRRAGVIRQRLIGMGASPAQIETSGNGSASPLVPNDSDANREINRRVEFIIL